MTCRCRELEAEVARLRQIIETQIEAFRSAGFQGSASNLRDELDGPPRGGYVPKVRP